MSEWKKFISCGSARKFLYLHPKGINFVESPSCFELIKSETERAVFKAESLSRLQGPVTSVTVNRIQDSLPL